MLFFRPRAAPIGLATMILFGGCLRLGYERQGSAADGGPRDQGGTSIEASADASRSDHAADAVGPDPGTDQGLADRGGADQGAADLPGAADQGAADLPGAADQGSVLQACAGGVAAAQAYGPTMMICKLPTKLSTQCTAATLCNASAGWHRCTASEFLAGGGATTPSAESAWIGSCVRAANATNAPTEGPCPSCVDSTTMSTTTGWACDSAGATELTASSAIYVGLATHTACVAVGKKGEAVEAYWIAVPSATELDATVCCN